jgi:hypothetical protein
VVGPNPPPPVGPVAAPGTFGLVNAGNGEMRVETVDMLLPSPRMPIVFRARSAARIYTRARSAAAGTSTTRSASCRSTATSSRTASGCRSSSATAKRSTRAQTRDVVLQTGKSSAVLFEQSGTSPPPEIASDPLLQAKGWLDASDYYLPQKGVFDALLRFDDSQFLRVTPDGTSTGTRRAAGSSASTTAGRRTGTSSPTTTATN